MFDSILPMGKGSPLAARRIALIVGMAAVAATLYWFGQGAAGKVQNAAPVPPIQSTAREPSQDSMLALRYANAYQSGNCDEVIGLTWWMVERLRKAEMASPQAANLEPIRDELRSRILNRAVEGNRLRPEGVEDAYVFAPGTALEWVASDRGHEDLSAPVRERAWIRVTYPTPDLALCDESGRPIRSITVGVNVSPAGYVVKAGVVGNLDIDRNSVSHF